MEHVEIFCQRVLSTESAFGIRIDSGEQAFIPSIVVRATKLTEGETVFADLVPNKHDSSTTPWFVVRIKRDKEPDAQPDAQANANANASAVAVPATPVAKPAPERIDSLAYKTISSFEGYFTTAELAADLGTDTTTAHNALLRLFNQGRIAKADVYSSGGQSRPSFCLWAASWADFVGGEE